MIRKLSYILFVCMLFAACGKPKFIPEKELSKIMTDIFMANSYSNMHIQGIASDTIDIYTPVLGKYGYGISDLQFTLDEMSKRKSSRLTAVVDASVSDLQSRVNFFKAREEMFDEIDAIVKEVYVDTVFVYDTLIKVNKNNAAANNFKYKVIPGTYNVSYNYFIDTADQNTYISSRYHIIDTAGKSRSVRSITLKDKGKTGKVEFSLGTNMGSDTLMINFIDNFSRLKAPVITIDSMLITHSEPLDTLRRRMIYELWGIDRRHYNKYTDAETEKDSLALDVLFPLGDGPEAAADVR